MTPDQLLDQLPHTEPFRFVQSIERVSDDGIRGACHFRSDHTFYKGHYPGFPITPGSIISEAMAQLGLTAFGMYLLSQEKKHKYGKCHPVLTEAQTDYFKAVYPGETITVEAVKIFFRFKKLKCSITAWNAAGEQIATGTFSGMLIPAVKLQP
jgi:3-hydroxyacyl-[acyl-carrier-protein] dehydratase